MKVIVVDENDNQIDVKASEDLTNSDIVRVSSLWVTNPSGQVLLARRSPDMLHDPDKWGPAVAGTVEENESYESNIYKEAVEEIGLSDVKFKLGSKVVNKNYRTFFVQWYTCELDWPIEKFKLQIDEVATIKWIDKENLINQLKENPDAFVLGSDKVLASFL